jgi:hypothetical protein
MSIFLGIVYFEQSKIVIIDRKHNIDTTFQTIKDRFPAMLAPGNEKTKDRTELNENSSNDIQAPCIMGAQPERKKNDRKKPHCEAAEKVPRVSS